MKAAIEISDALLAGAERHAAARGTTLSAFVEQAIAAALNDGDAAAPPQESTRADDVLKRMQATRWEGPSANELMDETRSDV